MRRYIPPISDLPPNARYIQAEVVGPDGSTVYTQAFVVSPVGDADGDYDVDECDAQTCEAVETGTETYPLRVLACKSEKALLRNVESLRCPEICST